MRQLIATVRGYEIYVDKGSKSINDFIVRYKQPGKRIRTPKHIHLAVDLCMKKTGDPRRMRKLLEDMKTVVESLRPSRSFPPRFQIYTPELARKHRALNSYGEYPVEFLLAIFELIAIQEKTNYPEGVASKEFVDKLLSDSDIFSIVSGATWVNRGR